MNKVSTNKNSRNKMPEMKTKDRKTRRMWKGTPDKHVPGQVRAEE